MVRVLDDTYKAQLETYNKYKNIIERSTPNAKGAFGEIASDVILTEKGFAPLHSRKTTLLDGWGETGLDGVFKKANEYFIVEAKYGSSTLSNTADGLQMSNTWINGSGRLQNAVGATIFQDINAVGFRRILAQVSSDGSIVYKELDAAGIVIGTFTP